MTTEARGRRWPRLTPLRVAIAALVASWMAMALVFWLWILPAGVITVRVQSDTIPGGKVQFSMPGVLSLALLPFVPDEVWEEAAADARDWLPASRAVLRELRQAPDFVLASVHTCKESVHVAKEGQNLQVHVSDPTVEVRCQVPIAVLDLVLSKIGGRCDDRT
jgi:hypothetical protein